MPLSSGTHLGSYQILSLIGVGGMGEVYRARDARLNRDVAIKVLPEAVVHDADRLARFKREAQVLASLNHPHIAAIYGLEETAGGSALILELVDGPTLADRIAQGPLPLDDVLPIAKQIAEALEAAHEQGIVHRDLKPANIKLTNDGTVKVLDFGLAKAAADGPAKAGHYVQDVSLSPTITSPALATHAGIILGTAAYMSPEQAKGKPLDKRTDIWAFGCVLFEMLTGKRAFQAEDVSETLAAILRGAPDWSSLPANLPRSIDELLKRCLAKDRRNRMADVADVRYELDRTETSSIPQEKSEQPPDRRRIAIAAVGSLIAGIAVSLAGFHYLNEAPASPGVVRFSFSAPDGWEPWMPSNAIGQSSLAVSADGKQIVFVARQPGGKGMLWLRSLDQLVARPLPGTENATSPFWSPDGSALGFFADGKLKRIDLAGGPPIPLSDAPNERGGSWSSEGVIVFAPTLGGALQRIQESGGNATPATVLVEGDAGHARPVFLPDGRHFVYRVTSSGGGLVTRPVYVGSLDTFERTKLTESEGAEHLYSQGHLLFVRGGTLLAQPLDHATWTLSGDPFVIAEGVTTLGNVNMFSASASGVVVYQPGSQTVASELVWLDRKGNRIGELPTKDTYDDVELSPDQRRLAVTIGEPRDIWVYDLERGVGSKITTDDASEFAAIWSRDGSRIYFSSLAAGSRGGMGLFEKVIASRDPPRKIGPDGRVIRPLSVMRDGGLIYRAATVSGPADLWMLPPSGEAVRITATSFGEFHGSVSHDDRWLAYTSDRSGTLEVYVTSFPTAGEEIRVSTSGGMFPRWRRDGRELFYVSADNHLMVVAVDGQASALRLGPPKRLFRLTGAGARSPYDVSADGERFIINYTPGVSGLEPMTVIVNWAAGLQK